MSVETGSSPKWLHFHVLERFREEKRQRQAARQGTI
jgi:hypothetical protein